jgi:hypothetical protein
LEVAKGSPSQNRDYCSKSETAVLDSFVEYGELPGGKGCRSDIKEFVEAVKRNPELDVVDEYPEVYAKYPRFVREVIDREQEKLVERIAIPDYPWCRWLSGILSESPDRRKVVWIVGTAGGEGKSSFADAYRDSSGRGGYIVNGGRHGDIYYGYRRETVVFFDWARDNQDTFPYSVVENFKNGYFLSTKYEVRRVRFNIPHVVVFSNFTPDTSKLSEDRWIYKMIINGEI